MYNSNMSEVIKQGKVGLIKAVIGALITAVGAKVLLRGYGEWAYGPSFPPCLRLRRLPLHARI